jgi:hypothetical protein
VPPTRIERATRGLGNRCSIQLSYGGVTGVSHTHANGATEITLRLDNVSKLRAAIENTHSDVGSVRRSIEHQSIADIDLWSI